MSTQASKLDAQNAAPSKPFQGLRRPFRPQPQKPQISAWISGISELLKEWSMGPFPASNWINGSPNQDCPRSPGFVAPRKPGCLRPPSIPSFRRFHRNGINPVLSSPHFRTPSNMPNPEHHGVGHGRERLGHDEVGCHGPGWQRHDSSRVFSGALLVDDLHRRHGCDDGLLTD